LHLQTLVPSTVSTVKSSPDSEKTFSFMCKVSSFGTQNFGLGPKGGLNG
jgi:hypothetical protein